MLRKFLPVFALAALIVTGCKGKANGTVTATQKPGAANTPGAATVPGCTVTSFQPTPEAESYFPKVTDQDWARGPATAKVTILDYSDFQ